MSSSSIRRVVSRIIGPNLQYAPDWALRLRSPATAVIEPTNVCNLACPLCPNNTLTRKRGTLSYPDFEFILKTLPESIKKVYLYHAGEPLLNKNLPKMVGGLTKKGIHTTISTNCTLLDEKMARGLLENGTGLLILSLDGATADSYSKYRRKGDFEEVKGNIKRFTSLRDEMGLDVDTALQFIVMKHNENEIPQMVELAKWLDVDVLSLKTVSLGSFRSKEKREKLAKEYLPSSEEFSRYNVSAGELKIKNDPTYCYKIWQPTIYWNGDMTTCCYDFNGDHVFANVFDEGGVAKAWKSKAYQKTRKKMLKGQFPLCEGCNISSEYVSKTINIRDKG